MTTMTRAPYSHYNIPLDPPSIAPTADDDRILLEVFRHDVIDSHTIRALLPRRSHKQIGRRLKLMKDAQLVVRARGLEGIHKPGGGSYPLAYMLGAMGARRLREMGVPVKQKRFRERGEKFSPLTIRHALEQTRFIIQTRASAERHDGVEFLYPDQIYKLFAPEILQRPSLPRSVQSRVRWHGYSNDESTIPDGFFMLRYPNEPEGKNRRSLFIEIDRGTMTIDVSDRKSKSISFWKDNSVLRKFIVYAHAWEQKAHQKVFGIPTFQVLTVTTTPERVKEMQTMYRRRLAAPPHHVPPIRFLFTDFQTVKGHGGDILAVPMETGDGKVRTLAP